MSGADYPRRTAYFRDALIIARSVIEDSGLLSRDDGDKLADTLTARLLGDFLHMAEAGSQVMFGEDGQGPFCSWCGRRPGPKIPAGHFQHGLFCDCHREPLADLRDGAA
jgi:hypothetical protein